MSGNAEDRPVSGEPDASLPILEEAPTFGQWVATKRGERGYTQEELAARIGVATSFIGKIESDWRRLRAGKPYQVRKDTVQKIATALSLPVEEVLVAAGYSLEEASDNEEAQSSEESEAYARRLEIGQRVQASRKRAVLTQRELSERIGVGAGLLSKWEEGVIDIPASRLAQICRIVQASADALLFGDERPVGSRSDQPMTRDEMKEYIQLIVEGITGKELPAELLKRT